MSGEKKDAGLCPAPVFKLLLYCNSGGSLRRFLPSCKRYSQNFVVFSTTKNIRNLFISILYAAVIGRVHKNSFIF